MIEQIGNRDNLRSLPMQAVLVDIDGMAWQIHDDDNGNLFLHPATANPDWQPININSWSAASPLTVVWTPPLPQAGEPVCTCTYYVVDHSDPEPHHPENVDREDDPACPAHRTRPATDAQELDRA